MKVDVQNIGSAKVMSWREKIRARARELRKNDTPEVKVLWNILRNRNLSGKKFYRQHPVIHFVDRRPYYFIADFYCHESKLIIETDGGIHDNTREYDEQRTFIINNLGVRVLRIKNEELSSTQSVIKK